MSPSVSDHSANRRVLITGGTGSLGEAMVIAFAHRGHQVTLQYRNSDDTAERLEKEYGATALRMDFSAPFTVDLMDFDVLVNCAGINESEDPTHGIDPMIWYRMLAVNLTAPFLLAQAVLPGMVERGWGRIVNVGSIYSLRGAPSRAAYVASKHGLSGLTKTIANEYAHHGITCNEICPAAVESRMITRIAHDRAIRQGRPVSDVLDDYRHNTPAGRMALPEEVAALAVFLCTEEAGYINGSSITVDGGALA
jgi:3-hydroxybutyrate dehydrogenase